MTSRAANKLSPDVRERAGVAMDVAEKLKALKQENRE